MFLPKIAQRGEYIGEINLKKDEIVRKEKKYDDEIVIIVPEKDKKILVKINNKRRLSLNQKPETAASIPPPMARVKVEVDDPSSWQEGSMPPPPSLFSDAHSIFCRIALKFSIAFGASFEQLLVKKIDRGMSGYGAMTSQSEQDKAIFWRNDGLLQIRRQYPSRRTFSRPF